MFRLPPFNLEIDSATLRDLRTWRLRVLNGVLAGIFVLWLVALASGINNVIETYRAEAGRHENLLATAFLVIAVYVMVTVALAVVTFQRALRYDLRAGSLLFILYVLGTVGLALSSLSGDGRIFFFALIVLASIFFDLRASLIVLGVSLLTFVVIGWLQVTGVIVVPAERQINSVDLGAWISGGIVFLVVSVAALISITFLLRALERSLTQSRETLQREQRLSRVLRTISEINQLIVREQDEGRLVKRSCEILVEGHGYSFAWIGLAEADRIAMKLAAFAGDSAYLDPFAMRFDQTERGPTCAVEVLRTCKPFYAGRTKPDPCPDCPLLPSYPQRVSVTVPLLHGDGTLGALAVVHASPEGEFDEEEVKLLSELADDLSYALGHIKMRGENERLHNETRAKARELGALYAAAQDMASSLLDPPALLAKLARHMTEALEVTSGNIMSVDSVEDTMQVVGEYWSGEALPVEIHSDLGRIYPNSDYATIMDAMKAGDVFIIHADDESLLPTERKQFADYGIKSMMFVPILAHGQLFGDIELWESRRRRDFTREDIRLAQAMAGYAAGIIENAQLVQALRSSESRYRTLVEQASDGIFLADSQRRYVDVNPSGCAMLGYAREEILSMHMEDLVESESLAAEPFRLEELRSGKTLIVERQFKRKDGSLFPVEISARMLPGGYLQGIVRDISERKRIEKALAEREAYFRAVVENSAEGVAITDAQGIVHYIVPSEERLTGYAPEEIQGQSAFRYVHPEDLPKLLEVFREGVATPGAVRTVQYRLQRKDGEWRHFEVTGHNMLDDPHIAGIVVNYRDITERILSARAIEESEERYRTIFESAGVPIWEDDYSALMSAIDELKRTGVTDFPGYLNEHPDFIRRSANLITVLDVNAAVLDLMEAKDKSELLGPLDRILRGDPSGPFAREILALAEGRTHFEHETTLYTLKGRRRDVWISITLPQWAMGHERVLVSTLDVTERKQAEQALQESRSRLEGIIATALNAIITVNEDQQIILFNPAAEKVFGWPASEIIGQHLSRLIPERYRDPHVGHIGRYSETGVLSRSKGMLDSLTGLRVNGEEFPMEAFISQNVVSAQKYFTVILQDITERKHAEDEMKRHALELETLAAVSSALRAASSVADMIPIIARHAAKVVHAANGSIFLLEEESGELVSSGWYEAEGEKDVHLDFESALRHRLGEGITGRVAQTGQIHYTEDVHTDPYAVVLPLEEDRLREIHSGLSLPLRAHEQVVGVLHVWLRERRMFTEIEMRLLTAIAEMAGNAIYRASLFEQTLKHADELALAYDNTLAGWARALELRDELTEGHTRRVTELTLRLARALNVPEAGIVQIRRGAILHDIGKMGIPDAILNKPGPFTAQERRIMQEHPQYAHDMLAAIPFLQDALDIPYCHHEHWNGRGYPRGLKGEEIPLAARIFSVVDVWDALTSDRPYRKAWSRKKAREYIIERAGKQFDPRIVEAFLALSPEPN